ncbi:uncharacterized protein LOC143083168 [Mytilus galloprovincialis]|uniref:uncharacterized protein LOC143083168 n=1 Tax=Mytilus galloprovincialis TaxID=29158 RepID=UPI003F7B9293
MAEKEEYTIPDAITEEISSKIVETYISIPGLEVKWKIPGIGTAELKNNCSVTPTFNTESLEVVAVVKKDNGVEHKYKYTVQKLPGEIIPSECSTKFKDGQITIVLKKANQSSWEVLLQRGLEQAK